MALPWLIGAVVVGTIGAIAASGDDKKKSSTQSSGSTKSIDYSNDDDDEWEEAQRKSLKKAKKHLSQEFKARCNDTQAQITQSLAPYFTVAFDGNKRLKDLVYQTYYADDDEIEQHCEMFFNAPCLNKKESKALQNIQSNLDYIQDVYHVEIKADTQLNRVLQEIEHCESAIQAAKTLQNDIGETIKTHS